MSAVIVDSNVLLDVLTEDPCWSSWSARMLEEITDRFRLVINPIIFAEVSVRFIRSEELDEALPAAVLQREVLPYDAAFLAGKCFAAYRRRGGTRPLPSPTSSSAPTRWSPAIA